MSVEVLRRIKVSDFFVEDIDNSCEDVTWTGEYRRILEKRVDEEGREHLIASDEIFSPDEVMNFLEQRLGGKVTDSFEGF